MGFRGSDGDSASRGEGEDEAAGLVGVLCGGGHRELAEDCCLTL